MLGLQIKSSTRSTRGLKSKPSARCFPAINKSTGHHAQAAPKNAATRKPLSVQPFSWFGKELDSLKTFLHESHRETTLKDNKHPERKKSSNQQQQENKKLPGQNQQESKGGGVRVQSSSPSLRPSTILILGSGWAAHSFIKTVDCNLFDVTVVSPRNYFMFTPMLPSTAVGQVEFRSLLEPIRVANPRVKYLEASCDVLDVHRKVAVCTSKVAFENGQAPRFELPYDLAVVAVGDKPNTFGVGGVEQHCFFMKEIGDAVRLRRRIAECFELANLPGCSEKVIARTLHFVVVGGGPTGVEFAGMLGDFVREDLRRKYHNLMPYVRVTLLEVSENILSQFDRSLAKHALKNLQATGVDVRMGMRVVAVGQDQIHLHTGEKVDYGLCVWCAGNAPRPLVTSIASQIPEQLSVSCNKLVVDDYMRVVGADDLIALGDCSAMSHRLPPTGQVAAQQGTYAAIMLNKGFHVGLGGQGRQPPSKPKSHNLINDLVLGKAAKKTENEEPYYCKDTFHFLNLGMMAYVGHDKALVQAGDGNLAVKLYGSLAFLLWQSVYIAKQVSMRNRVLILFDWAKARMFGRDISQF